MQPELIILISTISTTFIALLAVCIRNISKYGFLSKCLTFKCICCWYFFGCEWKRKPELETTDIPIDNINNNSNNNLNIV